jgi:hypothetical protein
LGFILAEKRFFAGVDAQRTVFATGLSAMAWQWAM